MTDSNREKIEALEAEVRRLRAVATEGRGLLDVERDRLHLALESGKMGTWQYDLVTGIVSWSATLEKIHGLPVGSFGGTFADYERDIHPDDKERVLDVIRRSTAGEGEHHLAYRIVLPSGEVRALEAWGRLFRDEQGKPLRMLGVCSDVTERAEADAERARLLQETARAVRTRDDLLAMVSHDLRGPLSVIALATALMKAVEDPRATRQIEKIERAAKRMAGLIDDLLDASSIESGLFRIDSAPENLGVLVTEALESVALPAAEKRVRIEKHVPETLPDVPCDRARIAQVLTNLVGNAVKFSPEDQSIGLVVVLHERTVEVRIRDAGPGIPREHLTLVFDRYWRGKQSGRAGAGLGLFISKGIVEAHGGHVSVESVVGEGSTFAFTLPLEIA